MARSVSRAGEHYGHRHDDLRLRTEYRQHLREAQKNVDESIIEEILGGKVGFSRTTYE